MNRDMDKSFSQGLTYFKPIGKGILVLCLVCLILCTSSVYGEELKNIIAGPDLIINNLSMKIDVSDLEDIPLGTIPDEKITIEIEIRNIGNLIADGFKIRLYLVMKGREDEIGTQIGSDITDRRINSGEVRSYSKSSAIPKHLKKGEYRVLAVIDTADFFTEDNTENNRKTTEETITPGLNIPEGTIPVYSPATISEPGTYLLRRDIYGGNKLEIFTITCSGVTLDGGGNTITGLPSGFTTGVYVGGQQALRDVTIKNLKVENTDVGVWFYKVNAGKIINSVFSKNANIGLRLDQSHQNQISENTFTDNEIGIGIFQSAGNTIYNNRLENAFNAVVNEGLKNSWSIEPKPGTNILGGSTIGGNGWFDKEGGGLSSTSPDYKGDGFSNSPLTLNGENIDFHPLTMLKSAPSPTLTLLPVLPEPKNTVVSYVSDNQITISRNISVDVVDVITPNNTSSKEETPETTSTSEPALVKTQNASENAGNSYADLNITQVSVPEFLCKTGNGEINYKIENLGASDAQGFQIKVYLCNGPYLQTGDTLLGMRVVDQLKGDQNVSFRDELKVPDKIGLNRFYLGIIVDPSNVVYEKKKENNVWISEQRILIQKC